MTEIEILDAARRLLRQIERLRAQEGRAVSRVQDRYAARCEALIEAAVPEVRAIVDLAQRSPADG